MALRGNLKDFSLPDVFQLVTFSKKTGVLRITREDGGSGSVWFRDGEVFFAQSNWHHELLGERLVAAQRITPSALAKVLEIRTAQGEGGRRLGTILVDEGFITEQVLEAFVQEQIQDTIFDLMRWDEGDFDFELLPDLVDEDIGLSVSIENVIMEGSRRLEEWTRIRKKIPSMEVVFKMATAPGEGTFEISLKPVEWNLLLLVDGTRSVAELATETKRTDFEVARIVYGLFSAGLLEFATDEEVERLRTERAEREAHLAATRAQQAAEAAPEPEPEPEPEPAPEPVPIDQDAPAAPSEPAFIAGGTERGHEPEVPEFLSGGTSDDPSADDMAVFEQMMGAVLQAPADEPVAPSVPEPPVAPVEPPPIPESLVTEPEPAPVPETLEPEAVEPPSIPELTGDLERDLMSLGLGELPGAELLAPIDVESEPVEPESAPAEEPQESILGDLLHRQVVQEEVAPEAIEPASAQEEPLVAETGDLSELLDSLGESESEVIRSESLDDTPAEEPSQVISTDAFLDFGSGGGLDQGLSGGLNDELSALTGAGRRPQASVKRIPEAGQAFGLKRDQDVDKDLVLKIIDGIKRL